MIAARWTLLRNTCWKKLESLEIKEPRLGPGDESLGNIYNLLGVIKRKKGEYEESIKF